MTTWKMYGEKGKYHIKDPRRVQCTVPEQKYSKERYKSNIDVPTSGSKYKADIVQIKCLIQGYNTSPQNVDMK